MGLTHNPLLALAPAGGPDDLPHPEAPGTPLVAPPSLADTRVWESSATDPDSLRVLVPQAVPMRRDPRALQRLTYDGASAAALIPEPGPSHNLSRPEDLPWTLDGACAEEGGRSRGR